MRSVKNIYRRRSWVYDKVGHAPLAMMDCWTCQLRSDKNSYGRPCSVDRTCSRRRTSECLFVTACSMDEYAKEKRTEKNLIVHSGISEAETTNNKRLRSTFCIEAIQTRSIARPLCDSRASCSFSISLRDQYTIRYIVTQQAATLQRLYELGHFVQCMTTQHNATLHRPWWSLRSLSALVLIVIIIIIN